MELKILKQSLIETLISSKSIIKYFYTKRRLFHPNQIESIEIMEQGIIRIIFLLEDWALLFFLKYKHLEDWAKNRDLRQLFKPLYNAFGDEFIYRKLAMLNACVIQRPLQREIPKQWARTAPRCLSRWNGLIRLEWKRNVLVIFVYNEPYCHPMNADKPLHTLPPPIIERFELSQRNVENYFIESNDECIVIDISLSDLLHFDEFGFIATDIKSDKESLFKKFKKKKYLNEIAKLKDEKQGILDHPESDFKNNDFALQQIDEKISNLQNDIALLDKTKKNEKKIKDKDVWLDNLRKDHSLLHGTPHGQNEDIYQNVHEQRYDINDSDDEMNEYDQEKLICPYLLIRGVCNNETCPYEWHPNLEKNVDFGRDDSEKWINSNLHKIGCHKSAHKHPTNIDEEYLAHFVDDHLDSDHSLFYLHDVIRHCFILRISLIKNADFVREEWYKNKLENIFRSRDKNHAKDITTPSYMRSQNGTKQFIPYPLFRKVIKQNEYECVETFTSPLACTLSADLQNADFRESLKHFLRKLNGDNGKYGLEAFCFVACLVNYPPIFIIEDFDDCAYFMLEQKIKYGEPGKVWQVLKKLSEGDINKVKWQTFSSSGTGNDGSGQRGDMDDNISQHTASCRERYGIRGNGFNEGRNVSFIDVFNDIYFNVGDFLNDLKVQQMGFSKNRYEWIKSLKITPLYWHLMVDQEKSCRMFRLKKHLKRSSIDFLRIEFQSNEKKQRFSADFEYGSFTRRQCYKIMTNGIACAGAKYDFFFFSDSQLKDCKMWFYSTELSKEFHSIQAVRNYLGDFTKIKNPGKMMSRLGLYMTKSNQITEIKASQMEFIDDLRAEDGKELTDGCSIISKDIVSMTVNKNVVSMLARIGGAKCMLMALNAKEIKKIIQNDQAQKRKRLEKMIKNAKKNGDKLAEKALLIDLKRNENRNFNANVVITASSKKFEFDRYSLEVAVKNETYSHGCSTNKELIAAMYFHFYSRDMVKEIKERLQKYASQWFDILKKCVEQNNIKYSDAERFLCCNQHKHKFVLADMEKASQKLRGGRGWRGKQRRNRGRGFKGHRGLFQGIDYGNNQQKNERQGNMLQRGDRMLGRTCNEEDNVIKKAKQAYAAALKKLKIHLPFPSCKVAGIADWIGVLNENEIFVKIKVPKRLPIGIKISCKECNIGDFTDNKRRCSYDQCNALRPIYYIHEGQVGLLKNPCLHPAGYKLFNAVYTKELDKICDGECLLFSTKATCKTSPVFEMSGADLDGDEFWIVTQKDLLPLPSKEINAIVPAQGFDDQGERRESAYIDNFTLVDYALEYKLHENTSDLSMIHEAFSEHFEQGIGHPICLLIAKHHSYSLDYSKTGVIIPIPKSAKVPTMDEVRKYNHCIFPHFSTKHTEQKFKSTMIKGWFWDWIAKQVPQHLRENKNFCADAGFPKDHARFSSDRPMLRGPMGLIGSDDNLQRDFVEYKESISVNAHEQNGYSSASVNMQSQQRYEDVDDHSYDDREQCRDSSSDESGVDIVNDDDANNYLDEDDDAYWDFMKEENMTFDSLRRRIEWYPARMLLHDADQLTNDEIQYYRHELDKVRAQSSNQGEQWQAFHVDLYYEKALQRNKELSSCKSHQYYDSDDINENEDEKKAEI